MTRFTPTPQQYKRAEEARRNAARIEHEAEVAAREREAETAVEAEIVTTVRVPSQSDPTKSYTLHARRGVATCNCIGYLTHRNCKHARAYEAVLKEKPQ